MIPIFDHTFKNILPKVEQEYFYVSSFFTLFSNLLIIEQEKEENALLEYVQLKYLPELFQFSGAFLSLHKLMYTNLKKSCLAFISNLLVTQKARNYCLVQIISASRDDNSGLIKLEESQKSPGLFFLQNLILDSQRLLSNSVEVRGSFGLNTRRYLDNMTGIFINLLHGYNDKSVLVNIIQVLNEK